MQKNSKIKLKSRLKLKKSLSIKKEVGNFKIKIY